MIRCHIDRKKSRFWVMAKGDGYTISTETLAMIKQTFAEIRKTSPEAGEVFRRAIIAGVLDPKSPVWEGQ